MFVPFLIPFWFHVDLCCHASAWIDELSELCSTDFIIWEQVVLNKLEYVLYKKRFFNKKANPCTIFQCDNCGELNYLNVPSSFLYTKESTSKIHQAYFPSEFSSWYITNVHDMWNVFNVKALRWQDLMRNSRNRVSIFLSVSRQYV